MSNQPPDDTTPPKPVYVSVDWSGEVVVTVDGEVVDKGEFMATLDAASRKAQGGNTDA